MPLPLILRAAVLGAAPSWVPVGAPGAGPATVPGTMPGVSLGTVTGVVFGAVSGTVPGVVFGAVSGTVPVVPDADEARRWAVEELSQRVYQDAKPGLAQLVWDWIERTVGSFLAGLKSLGGNTGLLITVGLALALIIAAVLVIRPRLNRRAEPVAAVFGAEPPLSADAHAALARRAAADGDYATALTEMFRAMVRDAEERDLLAPAPGLTADEVAAALREVFPAFAQTLQHHAALFNLVRYGNGVATQDDFEAVARTATALATAATAEAAAWEAATP